MKIVSPFRDYYDRALAYGYDEHTVYVRKTIELYNSHDGVLRQLKDFDHLFLDFSVKEVKGHDESTISFDLIQVIFCGKTYRGVRVTQKPHWSRIGETKTAVFYNADALVNAVAGMGGAFDVDYRKTGRGVRGRRFFYENLVREWLNQQGTTNNQDFSINNQYIALVVDGGVPLRVIHNPRLSDYDFYRAIDPVTAYQELDMYISGVLTSAGKPMVVTEDKYRIQAAGFDKTSFRKSPTKHR